MIYLIESFMRDDNDCPLRCLKIGYAKNVEERMRAYRTHNPSIKLLKTREGEHDLENYLHWYFKRYELSNFNEWFIYSNKIIDNFELIDIQEETISLDEYLEYVRKEILFKIIPKTYEIAFSKILPLLDELEREFNEGRFNNDNLYSEFPRDLCNTRIKEILNYLKDKEIDYYKDFDFSDIRMDFPQIMGRQRLKENVFRDECIFIYKLADNTITMEEFERISKEKLLHSEQDLRNFDVILHHSGDSSKGVMILLEDLRARIKVFGYNTAYTGIDERTGTFAINKLVMISERRAFELRSNVYKSDVQIYNEFAKISSELSYDEYKKKVDKLEEIRDIYKSPGSFEYKIKSVCDILLDPFWYGKIYISDFHWLPLNHRNYLNYLGPERIKANYYREADIKKEMFSLKSGDSIKDTVISEFLIGQRYTLKEIKERIRIIYIKLEVSKTPKATDILEYFNVSEYSFLDKITKKRIRGYEIISLK